MPEAMYRSTRRSTCESSSCCISASIWPRRNTCRSAANRISSLFSMRSLGATKHPRHDARDAVPVVRFNGQCATAAPGNREESRFAVVLGGAPTRRNEPTMQEAHERGVHRSFLQLQGVFTHLFQ